MTSITPPDRKIPADEVRSRLAALHTPEAIERARRQTWRAAAAFPATAAGLWLLAPLTGRPVKPEWLACVAFLVAMDIRRLRQLRPREAESFTDAELVQAARRMRPCRGCEGPALPAEPACPRCGMSSPTNRPFLVAVAVLLLVVALIMMSRPPLG